MSSLLRGSAPKFPAVLGWGGWQSPLLQGHVTQTLTYPRDAALAAGSCPAVGEHSAQHSLLTLLMVLVTSTKKDSYKLKGNK